MPDGMAVDRYTLSNIHHIQFGILSVGGIVQSSVVPDKDGKLDIALGFDNLESYVKDGPYSGRLSDGMAIESRKGNLHWMARDIRFQPITDRILCTWGTKGFDKQLWAATPLEDANWVGVELTYFSPDGQMGFPGNLAGNGSLHVEQRQRAANRLFRGQRQGYDH